MTEDLLGGLINAAKEFPVVNHNRGVEGERTLPPLYMCVKVFRAKMPRFLIK